MTAATDPEHAPVTVPGIVRRVEHVMGLPISLALRGRHTDDTAANDAWHAVLAELGRIDAVFSRYRPDTVISRLGRGELTEAQYPAEVHEVLALAATAERASGGAFAVRRANAEGDEVLDTDGVVKGWAADRAAEALRALDDTDFCLSAGGDIVARATATGRAWRIGIEDPRDPQRIIATVPVLDGAVATSGAAHRGRHVVEARTGRPPTGVASVTVVHRTLTWADIDATAAYALGPGAAEWLRHRVGRTGLVVGADGSTTLVRAS